MTIGFIGLGNMAKAILGGILHQQIVSADDIYGAAPTQETRDRVQADYGIHVTPSNIEAAKAADVVILAVKPVVLPVVLEEIIDVVDDSKLIISVAAGKTTKWISDYFPKPVKIVRCMPNTPALVGEGCSAVCKNENVTEQDLKTAMNIISSFGLAEVIPENLMDVVGGVSGCGSRLCLHVHRSTGGRRREGRHAAQAGLPLRRADRHGIRKAYAGDGPPSGGTQGHGLQPRRHDD